MENVMSPIMSPLKTSRMKGKGWSGRSEIKDNNDEIEKANSKRQRKSAAVVNSPFRSVGGAALGVGPAGRSGAPLSPTKVAIGAIAAIAPSRTNLSQDKLSQLYSNCIKLSAENRINAKNTWNLNLIDHIDDVLDTQGDNFQVASCTLDASIKIYSSRVDSVHSDLHKVLGGLTRTDYKPEKEDEDENAEKDEEKEEGQKKVRKRKSETSTLEANMDNLNVKKIDLEFAVDPLFRKTSAAFDEGGARGLLLNHLRVNHGAELVFDSSDVTASVGVPPDANTDEKLYNLTPLREMMASKGITLDLFNQLEICPAFNDFLRNREQRDQGVSTAPEATADWGMKKDESLMDESIDFGGIDNGVEEAITEEVSIHVENDFAPLLAKLEEGSSEFSYFDPKTGLKEGWSGPSHWKRFRAQPKVAPQEKSTEDEQSEEIVTTTRKTRKRKEMVLVDFSKNFPPIDPQIAFAVGRSDHTLTSAMLEKQTESATTLPTDVRYGVHSLTQLFTKPQWRLTTLRKLGRRVALGPDVRNDQRLAEFSGGLQLDSVEEDPLKTAQSGGVTWYNYDNPNDKENYVPDLMGDYDDDGIQDDISVDDIRPVPLTLVTDTIVEEGQSGPDLGRADGVVPPDAVTEDAIRQLAGLSISEQLVKAPVRVENVDVKYAKFEKKVDVRALKDSIWTTMKNMCSTKGDRISTTPLPFSKVLSALPQNLEGNRPENVSLPFCFICLLHLANEKNLKITDQDDLGDLLVQQDSDIN